MQWLEKVWTAAVATFSVLTLTPFRDGGDTQVPIAVDLSPSLEATLPLYPHIASDDVPSFDPPGAPKDPDFKCEYPEMVGWESCSSPRDRKCWLRRKSDGKQFDVYSDYENEWPIGITREYELDIADGHWDADGMNFPDAKLFNGTYPGPWIQACWGDTLVVKVTNSLKKNGTSVHWHGIRQHNSVQMDGVNGITQCPIAPDDYFVYNFTLKQYGSSWYHSHYSVQYADGAAGPMTIHGPSSADWDEAVSPPLVMTDWYHNSSFYVLTTRDSSNVYKDILLNGRGNITKFSTTPNSTEIKPAFNTTFEPPRPGRANKKYLIRVINTSFDTTFVFSIDNHLLQVVSADFVPIVPYQNTSILVGIGQRYNVIVEANPLAEESALDPNGNYWIRTEVSQCFGGDPGNETTAETGILRYNASSKLDPNTRRWKGISTYCSDETYTSLSPILPWIVAPPSNHPQDSPPTNYGEELEVYFGSRKPKDYPVAGFTLDNTGQAVPMRVNYSDPILLHLNPDDEKPLNETLWRVVPEDLKDNKWIYFVLAGRKSTGSTAAAHPIHLHGHDFAILEQAEQKRWDPQNMNLNLINPPRRDVVLLPTNGYVVIAFKADNPGPWLAHCHIAVHVSMGLSFQLLENRAQAFKFWPDSHSAIVEANRVCHNWTKWYNNQSNWAWPPQPKGSCSYSDHPDWCFQDDSGV